MPGSSFAIGTSSRVAANLDVIGNAEDTYANQKKLEGW